MVVNIRSVKTKLKPTMEAGAALGFSNPPPTHASMGKQMLNDSSLFLSIEHLEPWYMKMPHAAQLVVGMACGVEVGADRLTIHA